MITILNLEDIGARSTALNINVRKTGLQTTATQQLTRQIEQLIQVLLTFIVHLNMKDVCRRIGPHLDGGCILDKFVNVHRMVDNTAWEGNVVQIGTVFARSTVIVLGIGPRIGVRSRSHRERGVCPRDTTTPSPYLTSIDLECQLVISFFRGNLVIEGYTVIDGGLDGNFQRCIAIVIDLTGFGAISARI